MAGSPSHLRPVPPLPADEDGDDLAVLAASLVAGLVPWLGLALLGHWSGTELGAALLPLVVALAQLVHLLSPARRRSRRR